MSRVLYPRARRSCYYVSAGSQFLHLGEDGRTELSTCPHRATLFTSMSLAKRCMEDVRKVMPEHVRVELRPTATWENFVVGDPLHRRQKKEKPSGT